ncbi:MAG: hypothetical protein M3Y82_06705 [Verrucomicrobiota bacterium]|nr:hypothetical protein [Verrucomicrobiota bacterium]
MKSAFGLMENGAEYNENEKKNFSGVGGLMKGKSLPYCLPQDFMGITSE